LVFIGVLLALSGFAIYGMRIKSNNLKTKYPKTTCKDTIKMYKSDMAVWELQAVNEYITNRKLSLEGKRTYYGNTMQCFCNYEK
jgi:hypothetical protein